MRRLQIHELLHEGRDNPTTGRELCSITGLTQRDITTLIEAERKAGIPICASCDGGNPGYYMARDTDELERYIDSLKRRIRQMSRTCSALERIAI